VSENPEAWTIEHFSQANPAGEGQANVPNLLRRVATSLDALGDIEVQDVVLHSEIDDDGQPSPSITVYFSRA
jgi:hypothetical protein